MFATPPVKPQDLLTKKKSYFRFELELSAIGHLELQVGSSFVSKERLVVDFRESDLSFSALSGTVVSAT